MPAATSTPTINELFAAELRELGSHLDAIHTALHDAPRGRLGIDSARHRYGELKDRVQARWKEATEFAKTLGTADRQCFDAFVVPALNDIRVSLSAPRNARPERILASLGSGGNRLQWWLSQLE